MRACATKLYVTVHVRTTRPIANNLLIYAAGRQPRKVQITLLTETSENTDTRITRDEFSFIARLSVVSVSRMFGLFMVLPVLAIWSNELAGATPLLVGVAVGGYGVTQALLQLPYGALSDRIGRAPVVVFGLSVFVVGSGLAAGADTIWGVILGRLLQGAGAVSATLSAWLADRTRASIRTPAMAIFGATIGASFLLALVFGALLSEAIGVRGLFWLSAALGVLGIALVVPFLGQRQTRPMPAKVLQRDWRLILQAELVSLNLAVLILHAALTAFFVLVPFALTDRLGLSADGHWKLYSLTLLLSLPIAIPLIARDGRAGQSGFLLPALGMLATGFAAMVFCGEQLAVFGFGCTLFFAGFSYLEAALPAQVSRRADPAQRGASLGLFAASQFFGAFVGGVAGGWFIGGAGYDAGLLTVTAVLAVWLLVSSIKTGRSGA